MFIPWYSEYFFVKLLQTWCKEPERIKVRKANDRILIIFLIQVKLPVLRSIFCAVILNPRNMIISQELLAKTDFPSNFVSVTILYRSFIFTFQNARRTGARKRVRKAICAMTRHYLYASKLQVFLQLYSGGKISLNPPKCLISKTRKARLRKTEKSQNTNKKYLTLPTQCEHTEHYLRIRHLNCLLTTQILFLCTQDF